MTISVRHVLICNYDIVLCCHVISKIVIYYEPKQTVEESKINLFKNLIVFCLKKHSTLLILCFPNISQVVQSLTIFVSK